ncbi:TonB family protein [Phaeobacter sp. QD34_3]|uniref:TonB family protein n=1 Tax=unclassified Phaeobacter TaxID=2621772 RepID=UPI00237FB7C9|nr:MULTISPECIES: TonB family protein [unclassified Phaeobacter]MDE4133133.1 TonB family protein [Phaeobacter sp. QD34_3]MDE4136797.1 TonB family protein [Phaeobacter sp. QD34_24]MDE4173104.1 TonB family protein [Phaeobacter sp. PT47_59]
MSRVPQSRLVALVALALAAMVHAGGVALTNTPKIKQAGGETELAAVGGSFANLAVGVETPEPAEELTEQPQEPEQTPEIAEPVETAEAPPPPQAVTPVIPAMQMPPVEEAAPTPVVTAALTPGIEIAPPRAQPTETPPPSETAVAPPATSVTETAAVPPPEPVTPDAAAPVAETTTPLPVQTAMTPPPQQAVQEPVPQAPEVTVSLKPVTRPSRPPEPIKAQPKPDPVQPVERVTKRQEPPAKPRGNSDVNATRGVAQATAKQPSGQSRSGGGTAKVQGNAAASNYPGLVLRRIERAKRRATVRGVATVSFRIAPNGGLAAVGLARSSGSGKLDQIAVAQVRRAAPFPPPPPGARTSFTVRIKGK